MYTFDVLSVCHSLGQSVKDIDLFIFWLKPQGYSYSQKFYKIQNICMVNTFTFNVLSVGPSFGQQVTGIVVSIFWPIPWEYSFSQKIL